MLLLFIAILLAVFEPLPSQKELSALSIASHVTWKWSVASTLKTVLSRLNTVRTTHEKLRTEEPAIPPLPDLEGSESETRGQYGVVPTLIVDIDRGADFPRPFSQPWRASWYGLTVNSREIMRAVDLLEATASLRDTPPSRLEHFAEIETLWVDARAKFSRIAKKGRYLDGWIKPSLAQATHHSPALQLASNYGNMGAPLQNLRNAFQPAREVSRKFLPDKMRDWRNREIVIPVATDVSDRSFLIEVENTLDQFWNHAPAVNGIHAKLKIKWSHIAYDTFFASGMINLEGHVKKFPPDSAGLTTGGLTTAVSENVLVLAPGQLTVRTLAHEIGHWLGFTDCYFRTLSGDGLFGIAVLEWSNPFFPDHLMCDNAVGVLGSEKWEID